MKIHHQCVFYGLWVMLSGIAGCAHSSPEEITPHDSDVDSGITDSGMPDSGIQDSGTLDGGTEIEPLLSDCLKVNACQASGGTPIGLNACYGQLLKRPWAPVMLGPMRLQVSAIDCMFAGLSQCDKVLACTPSLDQFTDYCAQSGGGDYCRQNSWIYCDDSTSEPLVAMDCSAALQVCSKDAWAACGTETCTYGTDISKCDPADPNILIECNAAGLWTRIDCKTAYNYVIVTDATGDKVYTIAGETCGYNEEMGAMGCIGKGEPCTFFSQTCDGDVLKTCAGRKLGERDCSQIEPGGLSCGIMESGQFAGAATCGLLDPACALDGNETCANGQITFCAMDEVKTIDCRSLGYSGCATQTAEQRTVAYCVP